MLYQLNNKEGESMGIISTNALPEVVETEWENSFPLGAIVEDDGLTAIDHLCAELVKQNYKAEQTWLEEINP